RPLVEPRRRGPGDGPRVPHRADPARAGAPDHRRGDDRGPHRRTAGAQEGAGRRGARRRRGGAHRTDGRRAGGAGRAARGTGMNAYDGDGAGAERTFAALPPARGRAFAQTWWGRAWLTALEGTALDNEQLKAGRRLARAGAVG